VPHVAGRRRHHVQIVHPHVARRALVPRVVALLTVSFDTGRGKLVAEKEEEERRDTCSGWAPLGPWARRA
jgi:hypothetical protein